MARKKKLVTEDPSSQIEQLKIEIENLTQELKAKKTAVSYTHLTLPTIA